MYVIKITGSFIYSSFDTVTYDTFFVLLPEYPAANTRQCNYNEGYLKVLFQIIFF